MFFRGNVSNSFVIVILFLIVSSSTGDAGMFDFFSKKAPSCDDKKIINQIISSLNNDQQFKIEINNDIYGYICGPAIADRKKADAEVAALSSPTSPSEYRNWNDKSNRLFQRQREAIDYHAECINKAEARIKEHFNKSNTLKLTTIRTTDFNKNTGTNFCVGNLEIKDYHVIKKEYVYKVELTDGGKNYLLSGGWRNR